MSSDVHFKLSKRNPNTKSQQNLDSQDKDISEVRVEYFEQKVPKNLILKKDDDNLLNLRIYSTQEGRIVPRKVRASSSKKGQTPTNIDRQNGKQSQSQQDWMKQIGNKQISELKKQQKRQRLIFDAVSQQLHEKDNDKIVSCQDFTSEQNDEFQIKKEKLSNKSMLATKSNHFEIENEIQYDQNIEEISPIHAQNHSNRVEDIKNYKYDNHLNSYESPLFTQKKVIPKSSQSNKRGVQDTKIKNNQTNSYQTSLNKASSIYNIPLNSINNSLAKNKKNNQLLVKASTNDLQRPSSVNSNTMESNLQTEVSYINATSPISKTPITPKKQSEPMKVIRKVPISSSLNNLAPINKQNQQTFTSQQKQEKLNHYGIQQNSGSGSFQRLQQIKPQSNSISDHYNHINSSNQNTQSSSIKIFQKDKFIPQDSTHKQLGQKYIPQRIAQNQFNNNNFHIPQISMGQVYQNDNDHHQHNQKDLGKKYHNGNNKIIFSNNNTQMSEDSSIKFHSQNNLEEELEDISAIDVKERISTSGSNTIKMITNQQQGNQIQTKPDDKSSNIQDQLYGTIREDENEDFEQTPMQEKNIFKRIDKKKRKQLNQEIKEELEDNLSNNQEQSQFKRNCNSQDSTPINIQSSLSHRWNKSRFQKLSPSNSPKKQQRGKSVQCGASSNDQSFSAMNGVFEDSMTDSSMGSELQFQGLNHSHNNLNNSNKERSSQILSSNILDDLKNEENKTEQDELKQSKLTKLNLEKLVSQSHILKHNLENEEKQQQDYAKMNFEEKIAEINKIQQQIQDEKKKNDSEKQKIFLKQMELERQKLLHQQFQEQLNKEKEQLVVLKGDCEKVKNRKLKGSSCSPSNKSQEQSLQQHLIYLTKKQDKLEKDIKIKENEFHSTEKNIVEATKMENNLMNEIQFLAHVQNQNQEQPQKDQDNQQQDQPTNINQRKPSFKSQFNLAHLQNGTLEHIVSPKNQSSVNQYKVIVSQSQNSLPDTKISNSYGNISQDTTNILKEGWLYKKSPSIFKGWKFRYFVLTTTKLYYYKEQEKRKVRGCINFKIASAKITEADGDRFCITIEGYKRKFELKSNSKYLSQEWTNLINIVIEENSQLNKPMIHAIKLNQYFKKDLMTEEAFLENVESGDILLFETNNISAKFQRKLTGSKYDHVAFIIKLANHDIRIFDSTRDEGVGLTEWGEYIYINDLYEKVTLRKLQGVNRHEIEQALLTYTLENIGKKYEFNFKKLVSYYPKSYRDSLGREKDPNTFFCSELIAKFLKNVDLLPQEKPACSYWPISFSQHKSMELLKGASFGNEINIVLDRHRNLFQERKEAVVNEIIPKNEQNEQQIQISCQKESQNMQIELQK